MERSSVGRTSDLDSSAGRWSAGVERPRYRQVDGDMEVSVPQIRQFDGELGTDCRKEKSGTASRTTARRTTLKGGRVLCALPIYT